MTVLAPESRPAASRPAESRPAESRPGQSGVGQRIVDATLRCIGRWGIAKTTVDDVAREAGVGRATLYRQFPGGRDALFGAVVATETAGFFARLDGLVADIVSIEDLVVVAVVSAATTLTEHPALRFLLAHEPEAVLPHLAFDQGDRVLRSISGIAGPYLERWIADPLAAARGAEWVARIVLSYLMAPSADLDLCDAGSVRHLVRTYVLPGLLAHSSRGNPHG